MKITKTQAWVRIHGLPLEYWKPKATFSIDRGINTPLALNDHTMKKKLGFFLC